mmetsp:Transcript_4814/g.10656  ORF Transcript_4814/g.10656 Transcript_4814/m.10656 type:complete len:232 (+) Transcript_4814:1640-2335(+)
MPIHPLFRARSDVTNDSIVLEHKTTSLTPTRAISLRNRCSSISPRISLIQLKATRSTTGSSSSTIASTYSLNSTLALPSRKTPLMHNRYQPFKRLQYVLPRLGRRFQMLHTKLCTKHFSLFPRNFPTILQIAFVPNEKLGKFFRIGMIIELCHPSFTQALKTLGIGNIIYQNDSLGFTKIRWQQDTCKSLLAGSVPNLCLDFSMGSVEHLGVEFNSHRGGDIVVERTVGVG